MADVYEYVTATGTLVPDTSSILGDTQTEYKAAFGQDLVVTADTPQGLLIAAETASRSEVVRNNAALANQINPNINGGVYQDAVMALTGIQRKDPSATVVPGVSLTGVPGTLISAGTQAKSGIYYFASINAVTLNGSGNATVDFESLLEGPIPCAINSLTQIVTNVIGWETVNNTVAGVPGTTTQSDQAARAYRNNTLAFQGIAGPEAITSALYAVDGVTSLYFQENISASTTTINTISMVAHSIWVCINGGADVDVAAALLENKSSGSAWNGGTTVNVVEPTSGQTYAVKFERPTAVPFLIRVTTPNGNSNDIKAAILSWLDGTLYGEPGLIVGTDVSPFEIAAAINYLYRDTIISKVEITLASAPTSWSTNVIAIAVNQIGTSNAAAITVTS